MLAPKTKTSATDAVAGLYTIALASFVIALLYFARDLLIPLSLAALLTFLLAPLVHRLEKFLGRIAATLLVVTLIFTGIAAVGWVLAAQTVDLATNLPNYRGNIKEKLHAFQMPENGTLNRLSETVDDLKEDLVKSAPAERSPMRVVETQETSPVEMAQTVLAPLVGPLGTAGLVVLLVIFMLLKREDLRSRVVRIIGQGRISTTTRAMDEAGKRVSRYLLMQLVVNASYGLPLAIGLYFIGVPNAFLWGALAAILRFIPYIGPWIGAALPVAVSLAVSSGWMMPLLTIGLFIALELLSNNIMEPWLYGTSTGVSPVALIVAAVFWTWLWGPAGLILSTPLTVCLVVMGRHVPRLAFLSIALSDEEALTPAEECYYRLLSLGLNEAGEMAVNFVRTRSLGEFYDTVLLPVIVASETDYRAGRLDESQRLSVQQGVRDLLEELEPSATTLGAKPIRVFCLPTREERDALASAMLDQLLRERGWRTRTAPAGLIGEDLLTAIGEFEPEVICIGATPPSTVLHARHLCVRLAAHWPEAKIVVGLWGDAEEWPEAAERLQAAGASDVTGSLRETVDAVEKVMAG